MTPRPAGEYIRNLLLALAATALAGALAGSVLWGLTLGLAAYLLWTLRQVFRLYQWLNQDQPGEPPESRGLWGDIFDRIYRIQRRQEAANARLQSFIRRIQDSVNALDDAVLLTNKRGDLEWWNRTAETLLGLRVPDDRGQFICNLIRDPQFRRYFDARNYDEPLTLRIERGQRRHIRFQITLFGEGDRLILASDVTRLHHLEKMRRDFVSNVSHELRTPLTVIEGYLETLQDYGEDIPPRFRRMIDQMAGQARRMDALVTDLLMLSRIESQGETLRSEPVNVPGLLYAICQETRPLAQNKHQHMTLTVDWEGGLQGDDQQLRSCFANLIVNAIKYTPERGEIRIRWAWVDGEARLTVSDTGIGIDPVHIPRLTERFYRADPSRSPDTGGTGLGLAIVKHVLINHNARLEIHSRPGEGSTFTCIFPSPRLIRPEALPRPTRRTSES